MPEHPARHDAPTDDRSRRADVEVERLLPRDPDCLTNLNQFVGARMLAGQFQHHRLAPIAPCDPVRRAACDMHVERELGLTLSHAGERSPGR